jgi:hypothetical protein
MTTFERDITWAAAVKALGTVNRRLPPEVPKNLDALVTEDTANHLLELSRIFYMGVHQNFLNGLITAPQSPEYICATINNLYAFRHLADPESSVNDKASILHLGLAIRGLSGHLDNFIAVDHTAPERYAYALARLTVVIGLMNLGTHEWQNRKLLEYRDGVYVLPAALDAIVKEHADKAEMIVTMIDERGYSADDFDTLHHNLSMGIAPNLIEGTL